MTEDTCGYDTPNGPCQNPATEGDSCWIESHGGHVSGHGRPSKLDDYEEDILTGARQGMTLAGCARLAGVDESTLHRWINKYDEFRKSLKRARAQGELQHLQSVNDSGSQFILERSFGYTKSQEIEHSGDVDTGETEVTVNFGSEDE
jgi:hypothetical protein